MNNEEFPPEMQVKENFLKRHKKIISCLLVVLVMLVGVLAYVFTHTTPENNSSKVAGNGSYQRVEKTTIRLTATGDMIPHDALNLRAEKADGSYDYFQFMDNMKPIFDKAEINFCNQATLAAGEDFGITGYPVFNAPTQFAKDMRQVGCNIINTGTNHTNDLSQDAISASRAVWDDLDVLAIAGTNRSADEQQKISYFEVDGVKFAFLSYTDYSNKPGETNYGLNKYSDEFAGKQIKQAKQQADIVIVSMRWGTEYSSAVNARQDTISQKLADFGADVIFGHGPHVLEPVKKLTGTNGNTTFTWYSLGNFLNAQLEPETLFNGFAVMNIDKQTKKLSIVGYLPVYMHYEWTAEEKAREDLLVRKNFEMFTFDQAKEPLSRSQLDTSLEQQRSRIADTLNTYTKVPLLNVEQYNN